MKTSFETNCSRCSTSYETNVSINLGNESPSKGLTDCGLEWTHVAVQMRGRFKDSGRTELGALKQSL